MRKFISSSRRLVVWSSSLSLARSRSFFLLARVCGCVRSSFLSWKRLRARASLGPLLVCSPRGAPREGPSARARARKSPPDGAAGTRSRAALHGGAPRLLSEGRKQRVRRHAAPLPRGEAYPGGDPRAQSGAATMPRVTQVSRQAAIRREDAQGGIRAVERRHGRDRGTRSRARAERDACADENARESTRGRSDGRRASRNEENTCQRLPASSMERGPEVTARASAERASSRTPSAALETRRRASASRCRLGWSPGHPASNRLSPHLLALVPLASEAKPRRERLLTRLPPAL